MKEKNKEAQEKEANQQLSKEQNNYIRSKKII